MATCIIDCGGGHRGVFGAGVLSRCLDDKVIFDHCIGVSAGSGSLALYLAGQKDGLYRFYSDIAFRKEFAGFGSFLKTGNFIGLDYVYGTLLNEGGEMPLDFDALKKYPGTAEFIATESEEGKAVCLTIDDLERNNYWALKASCALPVFCKPIIKKDGTVLYDGALADPVPIDYAVESGFDKIVLILARPLDYKLEIGIEGAGAVLTKRKYPVISERLLQRGTRYNDSVLRAIEYEKQGKCMIIAPDELYGIDTIKHTKEGIEKLYEAAYTKAGKIREYLGLTETV